MIRGRALAMTLVPCAVALFFLGWPGHADGNSSCKRPEIRIYKREGVLELRCEDAPLWRMPATFGANPVGPKEREGDERTPEGTYRITFKTQNERFHRFLGISYPNEDDQRRAKAKGIVRLGGGIGIHGTHKRLAEVARAWTRFASATGVSGIWGPTDGCIGVTNEDAERLFNTVPVGTKVVILPSRLALP